MSASLILSSKVRHGPSLVVERGRPRRCRRTARTQGGRQDRGRVPRRFQASRPQAVGSDCHPEMDLIKGNHHHPERQGCRDTLVQKFDNRHDSLGLHSSTPRSIFGRPSSVAEGDIKRDHGYARQPGDKMSVKYANAVFLFGKRQQAR